MTPETAATARLRAFFESGWRPRDLVDFHSRHKLQVLAHEPSAYRELGRIVAQAGTRPRGEVEAAYRRTFDAALAVRPTRGRHTNALQHAFGLLSGRLDDTRRHDVLNAIERYRQGQVPLSVPLALLRRDADREHLDYLAQQTYLWG
ncbi:YbgA family protein [Actinomadura sp. B10D3]|uniref:YbgA family protein n=1 Tax=Actinomadura sp. B10D3 TaxID=3153557 RepID=UPI00325CDA59